MKKLIVALSVCLVLLLGIALMIPSQEGKDPVAQSGATEPEQIDSYQVEFNILGRSYSVQQVSLGALPQQFRVELDGLTIACWTDAAGNPVDPFATAATCDATYFAVAYPLLVDEKPFLFTDGNGYIRPNDVLTYQELNMALRTLAAPGATEYFPEISDTQEAVSRTDLKEILAHFFSVTDVDDGLSEIPDAPVTRGNFAVVMSRLLKYSDGDTVILAADLQLPTDITQERPDAIALLQASVSFYKDPAGAAWTSVELPVSYEPGFVNIDGWLYYVQDTGYFLKNDWVGTLQFGEDGRYTSGDPTLDATVAASLAEIMENNPDGTRIELLRDVYDHCHTQYKYRRAYDHPPFGGQGWEIQRANAMFETGKGNCYSYAAIFWALSRGLGYQTRAISGTCLSDEQPHSWCIIEIDGADYFFDPEWQYAYTERGEFDKDMFMIPMNKISYWGYRWVE